MSNKKRHINLHKSFGNAISIRTSVQALFKNISASVKTVVIDFCDIEFMSRSVTQQMLEERNKLKKRKVNISFVNISEDLEKLFKIVMKHKQRSKNKSKVKVIKYKNEADLQEHIQAIA